MMVRAALFAFVLLTNADGTRVWINANEVVSIGDPLHGPPRCRTLVRAHDTGYCVRETPEEVLDKVKEAEK